MSYAVTKNRVAQWIGIILLIGVFVGAYWYFQVLAGVKSNTASSQPQGVGRLDSGLGAYWQFDENTGTSTADASTNSNNGTLTNGPTWTTGQIGSAITFDGSNDYVATTTVNGSIDNLTELTYSAWIYPTAASGYILAKNTNGGGTEAFLLTGSTVQGWIANDGGPAAVRATSSTTVTLNTWQHVSMTYSNSGDRKPRLFLNGGEVIYSEQDTVSQALDPDSVYDFVIGYNPYGAGSDYFSGSIDEVRIYQRAFSADEVSQLYRLTTPTSVDTSLKGYWSFDGQDISGTTAYDRSGAGNNGTLTNDPVITQGISGQALNFGGSNKYVTLGAPTAISALQVPMTISGWFRQTDSSSPSFQTVFSQFSSTIPDKLIKMIHIENGVFKYYTSTVGSFQSFGTMTPSVNSWHYFAVTVSGSLASPSVTITIDGASESSALSALSGTIDTSVNIYIGSNIEGPTQYFTGDIDEIRIYNRALAASEIKSLYDIAKPDATNSSSSQAQGTGRLDSGLAGYWKLDETTGSTATDASTNGNNGTLVNMENGDWVAGQIGNGLTFDGTNEYINVPGSEPAFGSSQMAMAAWVKIGSAPTNYGNIAERGGNSGYRFRINNDQTVMYLDAGGYSTLATSATVALNTWTHIVVVGSATGHQIYLNGVLSASNATVYSAPGSGNDLHIGANTVDGEYFNGSIDEFRLYNRSLSADEIGQLYRLTSPTSVDTSLKGYWSFNGQDMNGTTAYDRSGAGNTGTLTNSPTVIKGIAGQALRFNGSTNYVSLGTSASLGFAPSTVHTVSAWANTALSKTSSGLFQTIVALGSMGCCGTESSLTILDDPGSGKYQFRFALSGIGSINSTFDIVPNTWYHVVGAWDGTTAYIYINGVLNISATLSGSINNWTNNAYIGVADGQHFFNGSIDEVRVYNRVLTAAEVKSQYDGAAPDKTNSSSSQAQGTGRLDSGLAGYWKLDDGSGTTPVDSSTTGHNGTFSGSPTWTTGQINGALNFTGTDSVSVGSFSLSRGTITAWVAPDASQFGADAAYNVFGGTWSGGGFDLYHWLTNGSGSAENVVASITGPFGSTMACNLGANTTTVASTAWVFYTLTFDTTSGCTVYRNAVPGNFTAGSTVSLGAQTYGIGTTGYYASSRWKGKIDEVRVYDRILSPSEIAQIYNLTTPTGTDTSLKGYWSFNGPDMTATTAYDRSGAGNNGTLTGGATAVRGKLGQGLSFDGANDYVAGGTPSVTTYPLTLATWFKTTNTPADYAQILMLGSGGSSLAVLAETIAAECGGAGKIKYGIRDTVSVTSSVCSTTTLNDGQWHHAVGVSSSASDHKLYIDGVLQNTSTTTLGTVTLTTTSIGGNTGAQFFSGNIDETRIYNRALTASEVLGLYNQSR